METDLLDQLKSRPDALLLIDQFQDYMKSEAEKREEFYNLVHEDLSAEFINGEIIMHSPVRMRHLYVSNRISHQLMNYVAQHSLGFVAVEKAMIQLSRNSYETDIVFFRKEVSDAFTDDQKLFPAPDLVVEILSESTRENDYGIKYRDYEAHGVSEYWIVDPDENTLEQYILKEGKYHLLTKLHDKGEVQCEVINDFNLQLDQVF